MKKLVACAVFLSKTGKGGKWMAFAVACMATAATRSHEDRSKATGGIEYFIVECDVTVQKSSVLCRGKSADRTIEQVFIRRGSRFQFVAGLGHGDDHQTGKKKIPFFEAKHINIKWFEVQS